ncbi:hypothetical protein L1887_14557 [Cichorium endivia]|nr:hypothetical protein L1887_14557 [Cichorium endivia]
MVVDRRCGGGKPADMAASGGDECNKNNHWETGEKRERELTTTYTELSDTPGGSSFWRPPELDDYTCFYGELLTLQLSFSLSHEISLSPYFFMSLGLFESHAANYGRDRDQ